MNTLWRREKAVRRHLKAGEIIKMVRVLMAKKNIDKPFRSYKGQ